MPATVTRRRPKTPLIQDWVIERVSPDGAPLVVDEDAGVIRSVRVLGQFSDNCHGISGVTEGTEYTPACQRDAARLYEGATIYCDHPEGRARNTDAPRQIRDTVGVLRNVKHIIESNGKNALRGDFHYLKSHPMAANVVEDVKRGLGIYGLSHNARPAQASVVNGRYVIERLAEVRSVDLVDRPATNKNLWESRAVPTTLKSILESWAKKKSPARQKYVKRLLEDDDMPMDAPADAPTEGDDPDTALWGGFTAAINAILDQYKSGSCDAVEAAKSIAKYVKAHAKLTGTTEPAAEESDDTGDEDMPADKTSDDDKKADDDKPTSESREVRELRAKVACMEAGVKPSPAMLKALVLLESEADRKALIDETKAATPNKPRSSGPPARPVIESSELKTRADLLTSIRG